MRAIPGSALVAARLPLITFLLLAAGCSRGRIELSSLDFKTIDPPAPRATSVPLGECYWWTEDDGDIRVAMRYSKSAPLHPSLRLDFNMSLLLEAPPRGKARNYNLNRQTLRAQVRMGPWQTRFTSTVGIAALYSESGDRYRGSIRVQVTRVAARLLGGWGAPTRYLLEGSFTASHDARRGREIFDITESDGWGRKVVTHQRDALTGEPTKAIEAAPPTTPKQP